MSLLLPAALAFGIIIPVIFLFYFMRPKRQEREVSSTLLWQQASQDLQASRPWQRLRITALLLLQILAAIVIVLILARPATFISSPIGGNTIIILQASASMQATDVSPSRFDAATSEITSLIDRLGPGDQVSLINMARTPQVLIAFSSDKGQLNSALQQAKVTNQDADLELALSLATSLAAGHTNTQILVVGDGHVLPPDQTLESSIPVRYLQIGSDAPNTALLALASQTIQGKLFALAQITNFSHQQRSIPVELYADGNLVSVQTATLGAEASGALQWGPLPPATRFLHAHIDSQDAMTVDHDAWAIAGGSMHGRVLLVTKGNSFLEASLRLQLNIDLFETTPDKYVSTGNFDLTVFDGYIPSNLPAGALFFVNPPSDSNVFGKSGAEIIISRISAGADTQKLLDQVDLTSIHVVRKSHQLVPAPWMRPVIVTPETPLLIAGEQNDRRIGVLSFDLHDSDLPLQPSFPILIYNLVSWFLPLPVAGNAQVAPATPVTIQAWPGATHITITGPGQQSVTVAPPFPVTTFNNTDSTGIYAVTQYTQNQVLQGSFVVNLFDPLQSNLAPASHLPIAQSTNFNTGGQAIPHALLEIWPWIAAFLLLVLCAEWWLFSRSYTLHGVSGLNRQNPSPASKQGFHPAQSTANTTLQKQFEAQLKTVRKRINRVRKRLKNRQEVKGRSNAKF